MDLKQEVISAFRNLREEYFDVLLKKVRIKDKYGNEWNITKIEFNKKWTIIRLGSDGTENYSSVMIAADGNLNELEEYEIIKKGNYKG